MQNPLFLECPHCNEYFEVLELNCKIFRHAQMKDGKQINPHASKQEIEFLKSRNLIHGCGGPFRLVFKNGSWSPVICDYTQ